MVHLAARRHEHAAARRAETVAQQRVVGGQVRDELDQPRVGEVRRRKNAPARRRRRGGGRRLQQRDAGPRGRAAQHRVGLVDGDRAQPAEVELAGVDAPQQRRRRADGEAAAVGRRGDRVDDAHVLLRQRLGRHDDQRLRLPRRARRALQRRQHEHERLARARLRLQQQVAAGERVAERLGLHPVRRGDAQGALEGGGEVGAEEGGEAAAASHFRQPHNRQQGAISGL